MKRKRGRKGKSQNTSNVGISDADPSIDNISDDDISSEGDVEKDENETNSKMSIETPSTETAQLEKPAAVTSTEVTIKPLGKVYNRLKVKIKSSKPLEPQVTSSDALTHSNADKSSQHISQEKQVVVEKVEDITNSVLVGNEGASTTQPKKTGCIKIKSSKGFGSSLSPCNNAGVPPVEETHLKEPESLSRDSVYNKQELNASLEVITRIMKTDASEPFNNPVNPVALGIPDYFDVIKTPMDFGTIRSNLESGVKYKNSEDVYKDVQYIWDNCYKYNNKGDYILELMKRVKKNFMKNWAAAGLYTQQGDLKDVSSQGKSSSKSGHLKHKSKKRHGFKRHKDDCLCAICIMVRRRQERETIMNPTDDRTETSDGLGQEVKFEGTSAAESPNGDDTSSSSDNSRNEDADTEMEDKREEVKLEKELQSTSQSKQQEKEKEKPFETNKENSVAEQSQIDDKSGTEKNKDIQMMEAGNATKNDVNNGGEKIQHENITAMIENQKPKELLDAGAKAKLLKTLHEHYDNPIVMDLCASLFPENPKSLWNRPHSLAHHHDSSRKSSIGAAIATFLKYQTESLNPVIQRKSNTYHRSNILDSN